MAQEEAAVSSFGEVFTRPWVVELILDLVGYQSEQDLASKVIVEPSCGPGAFLVAITERLVASAARTSTPFYDLSSCVRAYDLRQDNVDLAGKQVTEVLLAAGCQENVARILVNTWIRRADFLLDNEVVNADFAVGNPPYVRLEDLDKTVLAEYRQRWSTMKGRSDLYVGFIHRMLAMLNTDGRVGIICADRWQRNSYGKELRVFISSDYAVEHNWVMHGVNAFETGVAAYPAITVLKKSVQCSTVIAEANKSFGESEAKALIAWTQQESAAIVHEAYRAFREDSWVVGGNPWPTGSVARLRVLADLKHRLPPLEDPETGTKLSIGVATGNDEVYIRTSADIEHERLLPLVMADDLATGTFQWGGRYLINPWVEEKLVDLEKFDKLRSFFEHHKLSIVDRYVVRNGPANQWFRTIDRVNSKITSQPKLVLPELKSSIHPVLVPAGYYPHHNVYYIVSEKWDLEVLGGLLLSRVAQAFIEAYCVRMRNDTLRFQAQYLRHIRVPAPNSLSHSLKEALREAFLRRDVTAATELALQAYGLESLPD